jgi:membrane fusion protein (multidrug efflux system)
MTDAKQSQTRKPTSRGQIFMLASILVVGVLSAYAWIQGGRIISTENAYIRFAKLMVSTDVSGLVSSVEVKEGQKVKAGDVLFRLDPHSFQSALSAAEAQLEQIKLNLESARQDYERVQFDIAAQKALLSQAQAAFDRAQTLMRTDNGTKASFDQAFFTLAAEEQKLQSLQKQAQSALTRLGGDLTRSLQQHPQYLQIKAQVDEARRQLDHSIVHAPFAGTVTGVETLQPGTYLVSQTAALTNTGAVGLISNERAWIEANLKETDLTHAEIGNRVKISVDAFPGHVWEGQLQSIAPATGSEFSVLPAQNASGNWVKVVQRVPVHIAFDLKPNDPPLRSGMSVSVEIDTGHQRHWSELWPNWLPALDSVVKESMAKDSSAK